MYRRKPYCLVFYLLAKIIKTFAARQILMQANYLIDESHHQDNGSEVILPPSLHTPTNKEWEVKIIYLQQ